MAILDKVLAVGDAVRDKWKETFGEPTAGALDDEPADADGATPGAPLDVPQAYAALGLAEGATLADVREAYRALARAWHPLMRRDGPTSDAAQALDRLLDALELLEQHLLPLSGSAGASGTPAARAAPKRRRATERRP
jgi:hypothetical protein